MDEFEIESLYQKRFFGASKVAKYVDEIILFHRYRQSNDLPERIDGHIIITPLKIDDRIIDTSNEEQIRINFDLDKMRFEPDPKRQYLQGIAEPSRYGITWNKGNKNNIEVHRNGLVHFVKVYGYFNESENRELIDAYKLAFDLLQTIQFADKIYSLYDFMGKVRMILRVMNTINSEIYIKSPLDYDASFSKCDAEEIYIEREWDSWRLTEDYLEIGKKHNG